MTTEISEISYRISITLDITNLAEVGVTEPPLLLLQVTCPEDYPDVAPELDISTPEDAPKHPHLNIQEDKARLLNNLNGTIEENMGMAMIFTLVDTLKEGAELLICKRQGAAASQRAMEVERAEQEENRKFQGTPVTKESYLAWRDKFLREMQELEIRKQEEKEAEDKRKKTTKEEKKLTGKQLWQRGLAGKAGDYDEDMNDTVPDKLQKLEVTA